jgi:hypothetical protein
MDNEKEADPTKAFMRFNDKGDVETTDYPGDVYLYADDLTEQIIEYIMDHREDFEFPSDIQSVIDEYLGNITEE